MVDLFKGSEGPKELTCPMCEGKGKLTPPEKKVEVRFGEDPSRCNEKELALVLCHTTKLWELAKKFDLDPEKIKVSLDFKDTGHHMCFTLAPSLKESKEE